MGPVCTHEHVSEPQFQHKTSKIPTMSFFLCLDQFCFVNRRSEPKCQLEKHHQNHESRCHHRPKPFLSPRHTTGAQLQHNERTVSVETRRANPGSVFTLFATLPNPKNEILFTGKSRFLKNEAKIFVLRYVLAKCKRFQNRSRNNRPGESKWKSSK